MGIQDHFVENFPLEWEFWTISQNVIHVLVKYNPYTVLSLY